ncbi:substrate-binding periplasmic protein [Leeia oryzae]|uniref:substrate-binding periplasmic protein n=1 Tax=Leeia oryzae TaxID=356662 RepID=UPI000A00193B|nr:transporter substrate-binding domain-containing protein [Leeia oryzae]
MRRGCVALLLLLTGMCGRAETVVMAGTEWPPYMGATLPRQGAATAVVTAAFKAMDIDIRYDFLPWQRTVQDGTSNPKYAGYMPAYYSQSRALSGYISEKIAASRVGFAEQRAKPVFWSTARLLPSTRVGLVQGYVNTPEFDRRASDRNFSIDMAVSDENNLTKLAANRIDLALIDLYVFNYYLSHSASLGVNAKLLRFQGEVLDEKPVYIFFQKTPQGLRLRNLFNQGIAKINAQKVFDDVMAEMAPSSFTP